MIIRVLLMPVDFLCDHHKDNPDDIFSSLPLFRPNTPLPHDEGNICRFVLGEAVESDGDDDDDGDRDAFASAPSHRSRLRDRDEHALVARIECEERKRHRDFVVEGVNGGMSSREHGRYLNSLLHTGTQSRDCFPFPSVTRRVQDSPSALEPSSLDRSDTRSCKHWWEQQLTSLQVTR